MSTYFAKTAQKDPPDGYVVVAPRSSDMISGALRTAFTRKNEISDEFTALLLQIDMADRKTGSC